MPSMLACVAFNGKPEPGSTEFGSVEHWIKGSVCAFDLAPIQWLNTGSKYRVAHTATVDTTRAIYVHFEILTSSPAPQVLIARQIPELHIVDMTMWAGLAILAALLMKKTMLRKLL